MTRKSPNRRLSKHAMKMTDKKIKEFDTDVKKTLKEIKDKISKDDSKDGRMN